MSRLYCPLLLVAVVVLPYPTWSNRLLAPTQDNRLPAPVWTVETVTVSSKKGRIKVPVIIQPSQMTITQPARVTVTQPAQVNVMQFSEVCEGGQCVVVRRPILRMFRRRR